MRGSFGPGVFSNFDKSIRITKNPDVIELWDAERRFSLDLTDVDNDGVYINDSHSAIKDLRLFDTNDALTGDEASAVKAVVTGHDGHKCEFQIFKLASNDTNNFHGRLTRCLDRQGNAMTVAYADADPNATDAQLNYDRSRLWRIATVTDAYGLAAAFTYTRAEGQWVVQMIAFPNTKTNTYVYTGSTLIGVNSINHPDGSVSTFSTAYDATTQTQGVTFNDAASDGVHRCKTAFYSLCRIISPPLTVDGNSFYAGTFINQPSNRVRIVKNAAGEVTYKNWFIQNEGVRKAHIYEGGGESGTGWLLRYDTVEGAPDKVWVAKAWNPNQSEDTYTWELIEDYAVDAKNRLTEIKDSTGRKTVMTLDPVSGAITGSTRFQPDGTTVYANETTTYNSLRQPLVSTDRLGRSTQNTYDASGNLTERKRAFGSVDEGTWAWSYNAKGQPESATDANTKVTNYLYEDPRGFLTKVQEPPDTVGGTRAASIFVNDAAGRMQTATDAVGRVATYAYDSRNRVEVITYNDASEERFIYGIASPNANLLIESKDRDLRVTKFEYDLAGRRTEAAVMNGIQKDAIQSWTYVPGTSLVADHTDKGDKTSFTYDTRQRPKTTVRRPTTAQTLVSTNVYDTLNRLAVEIDPYGRRTLYAYDNEDRVKRVIRAMVPETFGLDGNGNPDFNAPNTMNRTLGANLVYLIEDMVYDVEGQLAKKIDANGIVHSYGYDNQGRLKFEVQAAAFLVNGFGAETASTDPRIAARTEYAYDPQGNLLQIKHPRSFDPADAGAAGGAFLTVYTYTGRNLRATKTEASGRTEAAPESYTYYLDRRSKDRTDARGKVWTTVWNDCCGRIVAQLDPTLPADGGTRPVTITNYSHFGDVTHVARLKNVTPVPTCCHHDPADADTLVEFTTRYDHRHRPVAQTRWLVPLGNVDAENPPIAGDAGYPAENGLTTRWAYDDNLTDGAGIDLTYAAHVAGLNLGAGSDGYAVAVTNPENESSVTIHDGSGRVLKQIDGNNNASRMAYDTLLQIGNSVLLETSTSDALNHANKSYSDTLGRVWHTRDAENRQTSYQYDNNANLLRWDQPNGVYEESVFDARNRQTVRQQPGVGFINTSAYDAHGNVIQTKDSYDRATVCAFDGRDRKVSCTDRIAGTTAYSYDANSNLLSITDAQSKVTTYSYDPRNLQEEEFFPGHVVPGNNERRFYAYDGASRLVSRLDQKLDATAYVYDMAGRLSSRAYPDTQNDTFGYDKASRLTSATSARYGNAVSRAYDDVGQVLLERLSVNGIDFDVIHAYDAAHRQTNVTYPNGKQLVRTFTARNQLESVTYDGSSVATRTYDENMRLYQTTFGNTRVQTRGHRADSLINNIGIGGIDSCSFEYDNNKNKTVEFITQGAGGGSAGREDFTYDHEERLVNFVATGGWRGQWTQPWTLSKVGDWETHDFIYPGSNNAQTRTHNDVHELTQINGTLLAHDEKGNLATNSNGQTYTWDFENRMTSATVPGGGAGIAGLHTYTYDALGRRVTKTVNGATTVFVSDGLQEISEYAGGALPANATRSFVYGTYIDEPLLMVNHGGATAGKYYYAQNNIYSVGTLMDQAGNVVEHYTYTPYGQTWFLNAARNQLLPGSTVGQPFNFTGRRRDDETGLHYYRARYYSAELGRFIGRDPIGYRGSKWNLYEYARTNPAKNVDPLGLENVVAGTRVTIDCDWENFSCHNFGTNDALRASRKKGGELCPARQCSCEIKPLKVVVGFAGPKMTSQIKREGTEMQQLGYVPLFEKPDIVDEYYSNVNKGADKDWNYQASNCPSCTCVHELWLNGHGGPTGILAIGAKLSNDQTKFCKPCVIFLAGCNTGSGTTGQEIANKTRCSVVATDYCIVNPIQAVFRKRFVPQ